jgi:hypothetical protein
MSGMSEGVQNSQWRLAYGRAAADAAALARAAGAREARSLVQEIVDDLFNEIVDDLLACCICYRMPETYAPLCVTHTQNACWGCVMQLYGYGEQRCPICREPLIGPRLYADMVDTEQVVVSAVEPVDALEIEMEAEEIDIPESVVLLSTNTIENHSMIIYLGH